MIFLLWFYGVVVSFLFLFVFFVVEERWDMHWDFRFTYILEHTA